MELSRAIALAVVVLGLVLATGHAAGEDDSQVSKETLQKKADARESQRRAALEAHDKRKAHFERSCNRSLSSDTDFALCRAAYRALVAIQK
jgi:hypothetical protein